MRIFFIFLLGVLLSAPAFADRNCNGVIVSPGQVILVGWNRGVEAATVAAEAEGIQVISTEVKNLGRHRVLACGGQGTETFTVSKGLAGKILDPNSHWGHTRTLCGPQTAALKRAAGVPVRIIYKEVPGPERVVMKKIPNSWDNFIATSPKIQTLSPVGVGQVARDTKGIEALARVGSAGLLGLSYYQGSLVQAREARKAAREVATIRAEATKYTADAGVRAAAARRPDLTQINLRNEQGQVQGQIQEIGDIDNSSRSSSSSESYSEGGDSYATSNNDIDVVARGGRGGAGGVGVGGGSPRPIPTPAPPPTNPGGPEPTPTPSPGGGLGGPEPGTTPPSAGLGGPEPVASTPSPAPAGLGGPEPGLVPPPTSGLGGVSTPPVSSGGGLGGGDPTPVGGGAPEPISSAPSSSGGTSGLSGLGGL